jgi:hypothetical protein
MLLLASLRMMAQDPVIAHGRLLDSDTGETGEFSMRSATNRVYWYVYDTKSYVERDNRLTSVAKLQKGDEIEVISDIGPDTALRYARIVRVVESPAENQMQQRQFSLGRYAVPRRPAPRENSFETEFLFPRGSLTFSGLVSRLTGERFVLRTRGGGEQIIYLRPDTRYMQDGGLVAASSLRSNLRVYVRGSQNLDGEVEAYQVVWGHILEPEAESR